MSNGTLEGNGVVIKADSVEVRWVVVNGVETRAANGEETKETNGDPHQIKEDGAEIRVGNGEETKEVNGDPHQIKEDGVEIRVVGVITKAETWVETWGETWADGHNREETKVVGITKGAEEEDGTMDGDQ